MKRSRLSRGRRIKPVSAKRRADLRTRQALLRCLAATVHYRCERCGVGAGLEGHEVRKPRARYWLNSEYVVMLCRRCHDMAEAAYSSPGGRLVIPGTRSTGWGMYVSTAANKWAARSVEKMCADRGNPVDAA